MCVCVCVCVCVYKTLHDNNFQKCNFTIFALIFFYAAGFNFYSNIKKYTVL